MDAVSAGRLRGQWPVAVMLAVFVAFLFVHASVWSPLVKRYERALSRAGALGSVLDPSRGAITLSMPPRVYSLLMENSAPAPEADSRAQTGALAADVVQQLSSLATQQGLDVLVAEPGAVTQQPGWNQARAHLSMRGSWGEYLSFLDQLARGGRLYTLERFSVAPAASGAFDIEIWVTGTVLKRRKAAA